MLLDLIQTTALLLALSLLVGVNKRLWAARSVQAKVVAGLVFGFICVAGMMMPLTLSPGVIVDPRSVILSLAGLFGGALTGVIAGLVAAAYRFSIGGSGLPIGLITIVIAVASGLAYRHAMKTLHVPHGPLTLFAFGVVLHFVTLLLLTHVPGQSASTIFDTLGLTYLLIMGTGTALLGMLLHDIDHRLAMQRALHESEARLRAITTALPDLLFLLDEDGRYLEVITRHHKLLYLPAEKVIGKRLGDILPGPQATASQQAVTRAIATGEPQTLTYALDTPEGSRDFQATIEPMDQLLDGKRAVVAVVRDVTQARANEAEIRSLAFFDPLTQLPNRRLLTERLTDALAHTHGTGAHGALMFIDLDDFKNINDLHGHHTGDLLLREAAARLHAVVRETDTVARFGGDEFVVLLERLPHAPEGAVAAAEAVAEKILARLSEPYHIAGRHQACTASIGLVMFDGCPYTADELMQRADLSMYESKRQGKNIVRSFDPAMQSTLSKRLRDQSGLRAAVQQRAFRLHYQAQFDREGRIIGAESLLRWPRADRGMVPPDEFIPLAEQIGLMPELGRQALEMACTTLAGWARHPGTRKLSLAVNISAAQLYTPGFGDEIGAILARTGAPPEQLKLELTESLLLNDIEHAIAAMKRLRAMGIRFSIDDFGTGYSSLSYLQQLPLDELKIDRVFVRDLPENASSLAIVRTIMALADALDIRVIAEGVETAAQHACLLASGCAGFQGYLFARPEQDTALAMRLGLDASAAQGATADTRRDDA